MKKSLLLFCLSLFFVIALAPLAFAIEVPEGFYAYTIQEGDTLTRIAPEESWEKIMQINGIDEKHLPIDQEILIPLDSENIPDFSPVPQEIEELREEPRAKSRPSLPRYPIFWSLRVRTIGFLGSNLFGG